MGIAVFDNFWNSLDEGMKQFISGAVSSTVVNAWLFSTLTVGIYIGGIAGLLALVMLFLVPFFALLYHLATDSPIIAWTDEPGSLCRMACMRKGYVIFREGKRVRIKRRSDGRVAW